MELRVNAANELELCVAQKNSPDKDATVFIEHAPIFRRQLAEGVELCFLHA